MRSAPRRVVALPLLQFSKNYKLPPVLTRLFRRVCRAAQVPSCNLVAIGHYLGTDGYNRGLFFALRKGDRERAWLEKQRKQGSRSAYFRTWTLWGGTEDPTVWERFCKREEEARERDARLAAEEDKRIREEFQARARQRQEQKEEVLRGWIQAKLERDEKARERREQARRERDDRRWDREHPTVPPGDRERPSCPLHGERADCPDQCPWARARKQEEAEAPPPKPKRMEGATEDLPWWGSPPSPHSEGKEPSPSEGEEEYESDRDERPNQRHRSRRHI